MIDELIALLLREHKEEMPSDFYDLKKHDQFRVLCNIRPPMQAGAELIELQNKYLHSMTLERGIVDVMNLDFADNIAVWQGDITRLNSDAVVNACNSQLLGCFSPLHSCIDNIIHTNAGIQVRIDCNNIMNGTELPNGEVRVTSAYNLPSRYIFHTVGPIVKNKIPSIANAKDLEDCYVNSLSMAYEMGIKTIAFCSISTGVYGYPKKLACDVAVECVKNWLEDNSNINVIFNVFTNEDRLCYEKKLSR